MSRRRRRDGSTEVRRRIAATAATAALAVGGPAVGAGPGSDRAMAPPRPGAARSSEIGGARGSGQAEIDAARREDLAAHRHLLASALAAELGPGRIGAIEGGLAGIDAQLSASYSRGERLRLRGGLPAELGRRIGVGEREVEDAFEAMARHARERRGDPAAR
jgi:hypothetical protein